MDVFIFLWIYFAVSLLLSLVIFILYHLLLRYGKYIKRSDAAKAVVAAALLAASLTFLWYSISTTLTIFNKWLMTRWHGGFRFPLLTASVHMVRMLLTLYYLLQEPPLFVPAPRCWIRSTEVLANIIGYDRKDGVSVLSIMRGLLFLLFMMKWQYWWSYDNGALIIIRKLS